MISNSNFISFINLSQVWRVGLMGWNAKIENARLVANALAKGIDYCSTEKGSQL